MGCFPPSRFSFWSSPASWNGWVPQLLVFVFCFGYGPSLSAQNQAEEEAYYLWFDKVFGIENTALYNGVGYTEKFRVINEYHKFFKTTEFLKGSINLEGNPYPGLQMKYDLDADEVLVNLNNGNRIVFLQPIKSRVESFTIDNHHFIHIRDSIANAAGIPGFYEVLWQNSNMKLLEKHFKKRFKKEGKNSVYYEFKSRNTTFLFYDNTYYPIRRRKDFIRIFPDLKKEIQASSKKKFPKADYRNYLISLAKRVHALQTTPNSR